MTTSKRSDAERSTRLPARQHRICQPGLPSQAPCSQSRFLAGKGCPGCWLSSNLGPQGCSESTGKCWLIRLTGMDARHMNQQLDEQLARHVEGSITKFGQLHHTFGANNRICEAVHVRACCVPLTSASEVEALKNLERGREVTCATYTAVSCLHTWV